MSVADTKSVADAVFAASLLAIFVKGGDLLLSRQQKDWIQSKMDLVTLRLDYLRPLRWVAGLSRRRAIIYVSAYNAFEMVFSIYYFMEEAAEDKGTSFTAVAQAMIAVGKLVAVRYPVVFYPSLILFCVAFSIPWIVAPFVIKKMVGSGRFWPFFARLVIAWIFTFALMIAMGWALVQVRNCCSDVAILWAGAAYILGLFILFGISGIAWALLLFACLVGILEASLKFLRWLCWRIAEYTTGAYAAILLLVTMALGIFELVEKTNMLS